MGSTFPNGERCTAEDAQYSSARYTGTGNAVCKQRVNRVDVLSHYQICCHLHEPWPDFGTFYGTPTQG